VIDEGSTVYIPNLNTITATARKNKLATVFCTQDLSQMKEKYGEEQMQSILSNLGTHFYGRTTNPKTAKQYSDTFGKFDKTYTTQTQGEASSSSGSSSSLSVSQSIQQREWVQPQEFLNMKPGKFVGFSVESSYRQFKAIFIEEEVNSLKLSIKNRVSEAEMKINYRTIKEDIEIILG